MYSAKKTYIMHSKLYAKTAHILYSCTCDEKTGVIKKAYETNLFRFSER